MLKEVMLSMAMQEEVTQQSIALACRGSKMTSEILAKLMLKAVKEASKSLPKGGRTTLQKLSKGGELENIPISDENIRSFEPYARKYGISYALQKDATVEPPRWFAFFKAKEQALVTGAFTEFSNDILQQRTMRPSVLETMRELGRSIQQAVTDRVRQKQREGPQL